MTDEKAARLAAIKAANAVKAASAPAGQVVASAPNGAIATSASSTKADAATPRRETASSTFPGQTTPNTAAQVIPAVPPAVSPAAVAAPSRSAAAGDLLDLDHLPPAMALSTLALLLGGVAIGAFAAVVALPAWLPGLSASLLGAEPKAYWYLSRSSAMVAYALTWLSMALGLLITSRAARLWPGGPVAFDLHQHASLLGLAFGLFHAIILLGDQYIQASLSQILVPFTYGGYEPLWVGVGQLTLYLMVIVGLSFYLKPMLGRRAWRLIHFLSFALFAMALAHGIFSGSDTGAGWARALYWATGGSVLFLTLYRTLVALVPAGGRQRPAAQ